MVAMARYLSGLKPAFQDILSFHSIWTVSEAYNRYLMIEKQIARRAYMQSQSFGKARSTTVNNLGGPTTT